MHHLTIRVAWHDSLWNGAVCTAPSRNSYCVALKRIRLERDDEKQDELAGISWSKLKPDQLPPCAAESGGFMNEDAWTRFVRHPYASSKNAAATHGHLLPTAIPVPEFATFAVPFAWMLRENQAFLEESSPEPLPPDVEPPFRSPWIFGAERQEAVLDSFFGRLEAGRSLVFFYCKEGQPLGDTMPRLLVGVGGIASVGKLLQYRSRGPSTYPLWDRIIRHSTRRNGTDGFLLPYHAYLEPTGDPAEDARRLEQLREIAVGVGSADIRAFSYAAEHATPDVALSTLGRCLDALRLIRTHGIAEGPWEAREEWINARIADAWQDRGAFPGLGSALEALGMRLGTALTLELSRTGELQRDADPWPLLDALFRGERRPPTAAYTADLEATRATWGGLSDERRNVLRLLSRFALTPDQARRWFDPMLRGGATAFAVTDAEIVENPYRIIEADLGDADDLPVTIGVVDRGLLPDNTIAARHPVPAPSRVESGNDGRRIRAALVTVLRNAAESGDSLLSVTEALNRLAALDLARPAAAGSDWVAAPENRTLLSGAVEYVDVLVDPERDRRIPALQLTELKDREFLLGRMVTQRAARTLLSLRTDWRALLIAAIDASGGHVDPSNNRHHRALEEQAEALERITTRKLSVLVGSAGTGKTSVLGALLRNPQLKQEGVLLLAPTGKARVRLGKATGTEATTIAQFLYGLGRYDGARQRPLFSGKEKHRRERTVVIDECSMLTMDDLVAVLQALDLAHVQRVILVGDPSQLPPIGVGRPFADLVGHLERSDEDGSGNISAAVGRLTVELRTIAGGPSDALRLASWFMRDTQPVDADRVLSDIELNHSLTDLEIAFWTTPEELRTRLLEQFQKHLQLSGPSDVVGLNRALGLNEQGWVPYDRPDGAENFQILSPVRSRPFGVHDLNRWVQQHFRSNELDRARRSYATLGDEEIIEHDKVIQVWNERRKGYNYSQRAESKGVPR